MDNNSTGFWDRKYWLPRVDTWNDVPTKIPELWTAVYLTLPILCFRVLIEVIGLQLGSWMGYVQEPLNQAVRAHIFGGFAQQTKQKKVLESFWRFSAYSLLFTLGYYVLRDKDWLYDNHECYLGYPRRQVESDVWIYYMIQAGFYISLLLSSVCDARRSDFWEMTFHHIVTIGLLSFSWTVNFVRVGTLILISHDVSDIFLELAKLFRYSKQHTLLANITFVVFMVSWIVTRLIYFPLIVVRLGIQDGPRLIQPDYEVFNFKQVPYAPRCLLIMLLLLLILHIFWTVLIVRIVVRSLRSGAAADIRSDSEEAEDEIEEAGQKKKLLRKRKELDKHKKKD